MHALFKCCAFLALFLACCFSFRAVVVLPVCGSMKTAAVVRDSLSAAHINSVPLQPERARTDFPYRVRAGVRKSVLEYVLERGLESQSEEELN